MPVLTIGSDPIADYVIKKHEKMKSMRVNWDSHWQEIADYMIPNKDNVFRSRTNGEKKGQKLFTSAAIQANEMLAAALHGMLTNPASVWFGLSTGDKELDKMRDVQAWLQDSAEKMIEMMNYSNFQTEIHEVYLDLGSFGTSLLKMEEDDEMVCRFTSSPIYEAYIIENYKGIVDTISYEYMSSLRDLVAEYGIEVLNEEMLKKFQENPMEKVCCIHLIEPRSEYQPDKKDVTNRPFASYKVIKEIARTLKISGFHEFPYAVPRWSKISGETYGRSPGMKALPDIKMLNSIQRVVIQGAQKVVDPPLQLPDDGVLLPIKLIPGGINYYRAGTKDRIEPIITGSRPDIGEQFSNTIEERIKQAFFIDQLQIRQADRMTATEVVQRREEQLRMLGPILGRQHHELLKPMVERVFGIMSRKQLFKPAPSIISDRQLQVKYTSQIARAQKTADADNFTRLINLVAPLAQARPELLDNFNPDAIVRDLAARFGIPAEYFTKERDMAQTRQARAEQIEKQTALNNIGQAAEIQNTMNQGE